MKTVVLNRDCEVEGVGCVEGQVVTVRDDFPQDLIRRVVRVIRTASPEPQIKQEGASDGVL